MIISLVQEQKHRDYYKKQCSGIVIPRRIDVLKKVYGFLKKMSYFKANPLSEKL